MAGTEEPELDDSDSLESESGRDVQYIVSLHGTNLDGAFLRFRRVSARSMSALCTAIFYSRFDRNANSRGIFEMDTATYAFLYWLNKLSDNFIAPQRLELGTRSQNKLFFRTD